MIFRISGAAIFAGVLSLICSGAQSATVELVFFLDYSASNDLRRNAIAGQMGDFIAAMEADSGIEKVKVAIMGSENQEAVLVQQMTDNIDLLNAAITADIANSGSSRDEDYLETMLSALPQSGNLLDTGNLFAPDRPFGNFLGISYSTDAIKSFVVLADEPEQSPERYDVYQSVFAASEMLVNVIVPYEFDLNQNPNNPLDWNWSCQTDLGSPGRFRRIYGDARLGIVAKPRSGVFSICDFDTDPTAFFAGFAAAKTLEVRNAAGIANALPVPLPPAGALMGLGVLCLGRFRRGLAGFV